MNKVRASIIALSLGLLSACGTSADQTAVSVYTLADGSYELDIDQSSMYWESDKSIGGNMGSIEFSRGDLIIRDGVPNKGSFSIDMKSIRVIGQKEADATRIVNQLKSDAFFASADYPVARFEITMVRPYKGFEDFNYEIEGDLSIRETTYSIILLAGVEMDDDILIIRGRAKADQIVVVEMDLVARAD